MSETRRLASITLSLRFRLTISYLLFFSVLLLLIGVLFRQTLAGIQERQNREVLEEQWTAVRAYLRLENSTPVWFYDHDHPEEVFDVERLRRLFLLADAEGNVIEMSPGFRVIGSESFDEIRTVLRSGRTTWRVRADSSGTPYLIRGGALTTDEGKSFYVAIGRNVEVHDAVLRNATWNYFAVLPFLIVGGGLIGWFLSGRALQPLNDVAHAAQRISGSNLELRIPPRGANDELDHLIETFNGMMDRLETAFHQVKQFSTDVSHELRSPITAIRGQLEVSLLTAKTAEEYRAAILDALQEAERLSQFVKSMLLLSQTESGQITLKKELLDLGPAVQDILERFHLAAESKRVGLLVDLPAECVAEVDRIQFERLVSNLLSNAIKYTPVGGEVRLSLARENESIRMVVEDTGCGIPPEHLPRIFDRLYRVPSIESADEKGLGLGLSFVAWIVKAHGGKIDIESKVGQGSRFTVTLPAAPASQPAQNVPS